MCRWELASVWGLASVFAVACLPARVCVVPRWLLGRSALPWRTCSLAHVRCRGKHYWTHGLATCGQYGRQAWRHTGHAAAVSEATPLASACKHPRVSPASLPRIRLNIGHNPRGLVCPEPRRPRVSD